MTLRRAAFTGLLLALPALPALGHPHVFADARLEIVSDGKGAIAELRNVWRFDEVFSSSVLMDFDKNADLVLDETELAAIGSTVKASLEEFNFYTTLTIDGKTVDVAPPDVINVDLRDGQLLMFFAVKPAAPMGLKGKLTFGVYDPTMYTAMDFPNDSDLVLMGEDLKACKSAVVRPDPDQVLAENQANLTDAFFNDPAGTDMSKLFATRMELSC